MENESYFLLGKDEQAGSCTFCLNVCCGRKLMTILGILCAFICVAILLIKDRKNLTPTTLILIAFFSVFIIITILFVVASVMLLLAALDENSDLISYYIWLCIVYLCIQLILSVGIPLILLIERTYPIALALVWMLIVMIVGLAWTHFISVIQYELTKMEPRQHGNTMTVSKKKERRPHWQTAYVMED